MEYFWTEITIKNIVLSLNLTIYFLLLGNKQELKIGGSLTDIYPTQKIQNWLFWHLQNQAFKCLGKLDLIKNPMCSSETKYQNVLHPVKFSIQHFVLWCFLWEVRRKYFCSIHSETPCISGFFFWRLPLVRPNQIKLT